MGHKSRGVITLLLKLGAVAAATSTHPELLATLGGKVAAAVVTVGSVYSLFATSVLVPATEPGA